MLGILPTIMNLDLRSNGLPVVPGPIMLLTAGAVVAALSVASYRANRSAVARMGASRSWEIAQQVAGVLHIAVGDLAPLLGLVPADVARWGVDGVPRRHQRAVADLHRAAVALTSLFPAQLARRLLAVRVERGTAINDARRQLAGLSRAPRQGHISVTLR